MEIVMYDSDWFSDISSTAMILKNQPTEKVNLDRTSDSNAGHSAVSISNNEVLLANCNDITRLDGVDGANVKSLFSSEVFQSIDEIQIDSMLIGCPSDQIGKEVSIVERIDENSNTIENKFYEFKATALQSSTIFPFLFECLFEEYADSSGEYDIIANAKKASDSDEFMKWLLFTSAYNAIMRDCTPKNIYDKLLTNITIVETTIVNVTTGGQ